MYIHEKKMECNSKKSTQFAIFITKCNFMLFFCMLPAAVMLRAVSEMSNEKELLILSAAVFLFHSLPCHFSAAMRIDEWPLRFKLNFFFLLLIFISRISHDIDCFKVQKM